MAPILPEGMSQADSIRLYNNTTTNRNTNKITFYLKVWALCSFMGTKIKRFRSIAECNLSHHKFEGSRNFIVGS